MIFDAEDRRKFLETVLGKNKLKKGQNLRQETLISYSLRIVYTVRM